MNKQRIIKAVAARVKFKFEGEGSGHDWHHIERVWKMAKKIGASEPKADVLIVELGALLHDIADWKFNRGDLKAGPRAARALLESLEVDTKIIGQVCYIVEHVSFKGSHVKDKMATLEGKIVQDADRLDAIGAIGIARNFVYGGHKNIPIYQPHIRPKKHTSFKTYSKTEASGINHYYEKLLLLKDRMHTKMGKRLAIGRHKFMESYLQQFFAEWERKK